MTGYRIGDPPMTRLREILLLPENRPNYQAAKAMRIHPATLSAYALGRKPILMHHLETMCEYLNVTPAELLAPPTVLHA